MEKKLIEAVIAEAKDGESNLVIADKRDTFTVEKDDVEKIEVSDGHLKAVMQDGKATVYIELDEIYKLVVEKEKIKKSGGRTGFGA
jgi:DNA-binding LytR/AlgR family response regulator